MARTRDLWHATVKGPGGQRHKARTARHPANGGNPKAKRWLAEWTGPDGKPATKAFARQSDADRHGTAMEADALRGVYVDPRRGAATLREYAEGKFLPSVVHLRPNSMATYESHLRVHVLPLLGDRRLRTLTRADMKSFVTAKSAVLAPATVETVVAVLRATLAAAVDEGAIPVNPCTRIPLPRAEPRVIEPLPAAAVLALHRAITPRYRVGIALGAGAGLRFGEATGLTVARVHFLTRPRVQVLEQAQNGALAPLKTAASKRVVPADEWVLQEISAHLHRFGKGPGEVIMSNARSKIVRRNAFGDCWRRAVADARTCGRPPAVPGDRHQECRERCADPAHCLPQGTRFHDLRHFYASALIAANVNPKVIQSRLGHATIAETMDTYGHLFADSEDLGRGAVDGTLGPALAEQERNWSAR